MSLIASEHTKDPTGLAIVTGGTNGFGHGLTTLLLKKGFDVVITSRQLARAEVSAGTFKPKTGTIIPMQLDLSDLKSVTKVIYLSTRKT